jgi:acyl carrier protein
MPANGNIEFLGRLDHQVKIRGFRIELEEIEAVLTQHPAVAAGVVTTWAEHGDAPRLVAYRVWRPEQKTALDLLRGYLKSKLPAHFVPNFFVELRELPLLPNGKVDRKALPAPDLAAMVSADSYEEPQSPMEITLAGIWKQALGIDRVGALDNFFDLGGHSLLLIQVIAQAEEKIGVRLPLAAFISQTLRQLAARYEELQRGVSPGEAPSPDDSARSGGFLGKTLRNVRNALFQFRAISGRKWAVTFCPLKR